MNQQKYFQSSPDQITNELERMFRDTLRGEFSEWEPVVDENTKAFQCTHFHSQVQFMFCPSGDFEFGLNESRAKRLLKLLAARQFVRESGFESKADKVELVNSMISDQVRSVSAFMIAKTPLTWQQIQRLACNNADLIREMEKRRHSTQHQSISAFSQKFRSFPALMTMNNAQFVCQLGGFTIPTESQWECAAKCWSHRLHYVEPSKKEITTLEQALAPFDLENENECRMRQNKIGLVGNGNCLEWTLDNFAWPAAVLEDGDIPFVQALNYQRVLRGSDLSLRHPWDHSDDWIDGIFTARQGAGEKSLATLRPIVRLVGS